MVVWGRSPLGTCVENRSVFVSLMNDWQRSQWGLIVRVFLSYSRRDTAIADQMVADIEARGIEVDIDRRDLPYGEEWQAELAAFIHRADTIVWLVSEASAASSWCKWELGEAQRLSKRLLPVRIAPLAQEGLPEALGRIHVLPAEGVYEPERHLDILVAAIETDRAWMEMHTRLADRAAEWIIRKRPADRLLRGRALRDAEDWRDSRPERSPAPGNDTLDLILQSRRAATRGLRRLFGLAVTIAIAMVGLAVLATFQWRDAREQEAVSLEQARVATIARDEAQLQRARIATTLAASLPPRGEVDQALLMLLDAAPIFGAEVPAEVMVAFHTVLDAADGRRVIPVPKGARGYSTREGLYLYDPDSGDLLHFDGYTKLETILVGSPDQSPYVAMEVGPGGLIAIREDLSIEIIRDGTSRYLGSFEPSAEPFERGAESADSWMISEDGVVLPLSDRVGTPALFDTVTSTMIALPDDGPFVYYTPGTGDRYLVGAAHNYAYFEGDEIEFAAYRLITEDGVLTLARHPADLDFMRAANFSDCLRWGNSANMPVNDRVFEFVFPPLIHPIACAQVGLDTLLTFHSVGSGGVRRSDLLVNDTEGFDMRLTDLVASSYLPGLAAGEFSWTMATEDGAVAGLFNRGVYVVTSLGTLHLARQEAEIPVLAHLLPDRRIAVLEPRAGRLVLYSYANGPFRRALHEPDYTVDWDLVVPLYRNSTCAADAGEMILPGGIGLRQSAEPLAAGQTMETVVGNEGRYLVVGPEGCLLFSPDWNFVLYSDDTRRELYDLARIRAGSEPTDAFIAELPMGISPPVFAGNTGDLLFASSDASISRLSYNRSTESWESTLVYQGELAVGAFESDIEGRTLLVEEYQPGAYVHGFLYAIDSRQIWLDLGREYKWYRAVFAADGRIIRSDADSTIALRLPSIGALIDEALQALPDICRPAKEQQYRTSPCWPDWLQ